MLYILLHYFDITTNKLPKMLKKIVGPLILLLSMIVFFSPMVIFTIVGTPAEELRLHITTYPILSNFLIPVENDELIRPLFTAQASLIAIVFSATFLAAELIGGQYAPRFSKKTMTSLPVWTFYTLSSTSIILNLYFLWSSTSYHQYIEVYY